ncbi:MAG: prepilin peptidase [Halorhodospira sp.]
MESWHHLPTWLLWPAAGLLGLLVGSFLNVVACRLPTMLQRRWSSEAHEVLGSKAPAAPESEASYHLAWPPSHCPHCGTRLGLLENIPLLSYLLQRGHCRHCSQRVALRYPLLEALTGITTLVVVALHGLTPAAAGLLLLTWILLAAATIDLEHYLLPDALTLPLLWFGLLWSILTPAPPTPAAAILGAAAGYTALWLVYQGHRAITGKEGMGYGDFKLTAALGAWLGWYALPILVLLAALAGLVIGLALTLRRRPLNQPLPFGPFLALAGWSLAVIQPLDALVPMP